MFPWYMFGSREGKGREKKEPFAWFAWFAKTEKWKEENVLFTLIPSLIGKVIKRQNRQNSNFERNKKSKNATAFPHFTFLTISAKLGWIGKGGPEGSLANQMAKI